MVESGDLKEHLLKQLSRLEKNDMTKQYNVINKCIYEMVRDKEYLTLDTLVEKSNLYYIVQDRASYGKIVPQRVQRAIGGTSRTAHPDEINSRLSSSGWRLKLGKSTCKAIFTDKNDQHEIDLNSTMTDKRALVIVAIPSDGEEPTREEVKNILSGIAPKGKEVDEEALKCAIEFSYASEKRKLKSDWWETTKINLVEWSKKG